LTLSEQQYFVRDAACQSTKQQDILEFWKGHGPLGHSWLPFGYKRGMKKKKQHLRGDQSSTDKKLAATQGHHIAEL